MSAHDTNRKGARLTGAGHRRAHLKFELMLALVVLVVFVPVKLWFEHTRFGHWLEVQAHVWLQSHLHPVDIENFPVVVVDLTGLKPVPYEVTENGTTRIEHFTPRESLHMILHTLVMAGAAGIGVDVDMSLETELRAGEELQRQTQRLFDDALTWRTNCAIFFGIKRSEGLSPEQWLGAERFMPLAASLARPKGLVRAMPSEFAFPGHTNRLQSLSRALAPLPPIVARKWREKFVQRVSVEIPVTNAPDFRLSQYLVDYSPLKRLIENRLPRCRRDRHGDE